MYYSTTPTKKIPEITRRVDKAKKSTKIGQTSPKKVTKHTPYTTRQKNKNKTTKTQDNTQSCTVY